ncbi:uncharacterized protein [Leptinotarsa decemlineata]|uniref:uncharacterized protein n=1 Tax=Leptinotarsa decemlineata TaxID=7539 RepID=UPI003D30BD6D
MFKFIVFTILVAAACAMPHFHHLTHHPLLGRLFGKKQHRLESLSHPHESSIGFEYPENGLVDLGNSLEQTESEMGYLQRIPSPTRILGYPAEELTGGMRHGRGLIGLIKGKLQHTGGALGHMENSFGGHGGYPGYPFFYPGYIPPYMTYPLLYGGGDKLGQGGVPQIDIAPVEVTLAGADGGPGMIVENKGNTMS